MAKLFKRGKKWGIDYLDPQGKRIRKLISPYRETAVKVLKKIETEITEGRYLDIQKNGEILFEDFAQRYFEAYVKLENKHIYGQKNLLNGLIKHFKGHYLYQINTMAVRQYLARRMEHVKPSTVNRDLSMLKSMFNRAIEWGEFYGINPTRGIKRLQENNSRCRWLTLEEQSQLFAHCHGLTKVLILAAIKTGLRWGEITHLKWQYAKASNYIDFNNDVIFIHESLSKGKKSRYIPLAPSLKKVLENPRLKNQNEYIFLNPKTGKPVGSIKGSFNRALKRAGIKDFTFHDLRHTFASHLVINGVDLYIVQKLLGHSSINMTQRYAHLQPQQFKDAIGKLEKNDLLLDDIEYNNPSSLPALNEAIF